MEQLDAGSRPEGVEPFPESALELVGRMVSFRRLPDEAHADVEGQTTREGAMERYTRRRRVVVVSVLAAFSFVAAACGDDDEGGTPPQPEELRA